MYPHEQLDMNGLDDFSFNVRECVDYCWQLLMWAKDRPIFLVENVRQPDPVILLSSLEKAYKKAAPFREVYCRFLINESPSGAVVETFANISASNCYHSHALDLTERVFATIGKVFGVNFNGSFLPGPTGDWEIHIFFPPLCLIGMDIDQCKLSLADFPIFEADRLKSFIDKETAFAISQRRNRQDMLCAIGTVFELRKVIRPGEDQRDQAMSHLKNDILQALLELDAISQKKRCSTETIARKVEGLLANSNKFKLPISELKKDGYVDSKEGRQGGIWLLIKGVEVAKKQ